MLNQQKFSSSNSVNINSQKLTGLSTNVLNSNSFNQNPYALNNKVLNNNVINNRNKGLSTCPIVDNPRQKNIDFSVKGIRKESDLPFFRSIEVKLQKVTRAF